MKSRSRPIWSAGTSFTDRLLHRRGRDETLLLGAATMPTRIIERLTAGRLHCHTSQIVAARIRGDRKITRQPRRTAIVAFSAVSLCDRRIDPRQHGRGRGVGSLSPRTRNAQVEMFQNGDVDYLSYRRGGDGLNLDVDHVRLRLRPQI